MIEAVGLAKTFKTRRGPVEAVRGIDLAVKSGEIFGFLGPNGAGKSTTMRMLTTLLRPSAGHAVIAGVDLFLAREQVRHRIGYVAQGGGSDPLNSARSELVMQGRVHGMAKARAKECAERAIADFELSECADRPSGTYSGGQRRRLDLALGMVHTPRLLFLDEPTAALDPQSRANLWEHVRRLREAGVTIFLTTHNLEEADGICDRLAVIDHGEVVAEGTPDELKRRIAGDVVVIGSTGDPAEVWRLLARQPYVRDVDQIGAQGLTRLHVDDGESATPQLLRLLDANGLRLTSLSLSRPSLDDVFLLKTGRSLRDAAE